MLSGSLKERLAQLKTLKAEEKKDEEKRSAATPAPVEEAPPPALQVDQTLSSEASAPDKSWVPKGNEPVSEVVDTSPKGVTEEDEKKLDPDVSSANVEVEEYEEIVENETEYSEREADVEASSASSANADDDVSVEEYDEEPLQSESEQNQTESQLDQDVFKALDEAEMSDTTFSSPKVAPAQSEGKHVAKSNYKGPSKKGGKNQKCIIFLVIFFVCVAIVAIILPFYLNYPSGPGGEPRGESSQDDPEPPSKVTTRPLPGLPTSSPINEIEDSQTIPPTVESTTLQWGQFLQAFLVPISGEEVFMDKNSPQYRAAKYVLDDPYTAEVTTTGRLNDKYACATFYFATEGENWKSCYFGDANCDSGQWLVNDVCDWHAVSCDDEGRVVSFLFASAEGNGLIGALPLEMKLLSYMTDLVIVNNTITGTLPEAFGESARFMRSLLLPDNELTGKIPENYLGNSPLEYVHLANNAFSGPIPTKLGKTVFLQQLDLSGNSMTGSISEKIGGYEGLEALSLANNKLEGKIPKEIYGLTNLKFLHTNGNELTGTVSSLIGDLSSLRELRIGRSQLSGYIPDELFTLTDLVELDVSQASFDGRLSLGVLSLESLEKLNVADNKLVGTVPVSFGQLSKLSDLNLEGNGFSGSIPESVCLLRDKNLEVLTAECEKLTCECCSTCL